MEERRAESVPIYGELETARSRRNTSSPEESAPVTTIRPEASTPILEAKEETAGASMKKPVLMNVGS